MSTQLASAINDNENMRRELKRARESTCGDFVFRKSYLLCAVGNNLPESKKSKPDPPRLPAPPPKPADPGNSLVVVGPTTPSNAISPRTSNNSLVVVRDAEPALSSMLKSVLLDTVTKKLVRALCNEFITQCWFTGFQTYDQETP